METIMSGMDYKIQEVAGRIRELRQISGYTIEEMAQRTGVSVEEYTQYENGSCPVPENFGRWWHSCHGSPYLGRRYRCILRPAAP